MSQHIDIVDWAENQDIEYKLSAKVNGVDAGFVTGESLDDVLEQSHKVASSVEDELYFQFNDPIEAFEMSEGDYEA